MPFGTYVKATAIEIDDVVLRDFGRCAVMSWGGFSVHLKCDPDKSNRPDMIIPAHAHVFVQRKETC